jgi:hypothetical protein
MEEMKMTEYGRVNGGDEDDRIWLMGFIYIYEIEQINLLQLPQVG